MFFVNLGMELLGKHYENGIYQFLKIFFGPPKEDIFLTTSMVYISVINMHITNYNLSLNP